MNPVTLKQLRYFDALARHLHFGRAAEACCVTQPALSMQIAELERTVRATLIERARGGLKLTPTGVAFAARAARILCDTDDLMAACAQGQGLLTGQLRLGVIPTVAPYLLPPLLASLKQFHADLELHVREAQTRTLSAELSDGKLDAVVMALPIDIPNVTVIELFRDHFLLAVPEAQSMPARARMTPDMLSGEHLLLLEEGHCLRDQALAYCDLHNARAINTLGISTLSTIAGLVAAGHGLTLLPEISVDVETRGRAIAVARFAEPEPYRTLGLAWRATSPRAADFHELARLLIQSCPASPDPAIERGEPGPSPRRITPAR